MRVSEILPKISHGALPLRAMLADLSSHLEKIAERRGWAIPPLILAFLGLFGFLFSLAEDVHTIIWAWEQWPFSGVVVHLHLGVIGLLVFVAGLAWLTVLAFTDPPLRIVVMAARDSLQRFVDGIERPPAVNMTVPDAEWSIQSAKREEAVDKLHYGFQRRFSRRIQDIIYRLGEGGKADMPLNSAMDRTIKTHEEIQKIIDRLTVIGNQLNTKK